ncbi:Serum opacity factor [Streptococcus pyogenes]|uniref:serum opacification factor n=1 Tax=Streptococcus pyogenes TaxID=1314 RepID=UPI0010E3C703|nr:serum opacification factor [Streptococcus pyogenes]VHL86537.1 Serum opacity factor [Streptococcus pyogenes]
MTNCKYKLRKLSVGLVSVGTMLIAPTVLGQEVGVSSTESSTTSTDTATTSVTAATTPSAGTSTGGAAASGTGSEANGASSVVSSEGSQSSASAPASPQPQAQTATATSSSSSNTNGSSSSSGDSDVKAPKAVTSSTSPSTPVAASNNSNQGASTEAEPQMMDVEQYTVDKESSELKVKDGKNPKNGSRADKNTKLIRNRDDEQRDIFDIKREVKDNGDGTLDVTLKVTPKEIDKGADVMALLDVSQKMTDADFKNAKDKIKKLVTTLTSKSNSDEHKHNSRNSVRLMTFYREISDPIDISGKTEAELDQLLNELREKAKANYDWGVDLQGAIHKTREIFNKEQKSKKRQHIVLFSQGESTFSYDIQKSEKEKDSNLSRINEKIISSNPLLPWPPIFDHTHQNADMLKDVEFLISLAQKLGVTDLSSIKTILQGVGLANQFGGLLLGGGSLTEYLTLQEYKTNTFTKEQFDYTKRVGEGYHYHSFSTRKSEDKIPFEKDIEAALKTALPEFKSENWFTKVLTYFGLKNKAEQAKLDVIMKVIRSVFYKRQYHYYNHNLSAIAEAKMAQKDGITFYSVDVTDSDNASKRVKRQVGKEQSKKKKEDAGKDRSKKFDDYLKKMSEGDNFLSNVEERDKFKDTLTELTVKDEFSDKVTVQNNSEGKKYQVTGLINDIKVSYTAANNTGWFTRTKESLTWTISKEQLKKAFEDGKPLTLTYKLKVDNDKLKKALDDKRKDRKKRDTSTKNENSVTEKIISNITTYKINGQEVKDNNLSDVSLTYSKLKVPVPQIDGHVIEPQAPTLPKLPPVTERGPVLDYTEESIYRLPLEHGSNAPDTQVTIEEDTVPQRPDILVGGQSDPIDITEDTQPGMSGSNDATVIEEDTKPKRFFHFDNEPQAPEKPKEQPSLSLPQAPVYKAAHHLPASGDKREASFTLAALTIIGAAGLLSKKRRDTEEN